MHSRFPVRLIAIAAAAVSLGGSPPAGRQGTPQAPPARVVDIVAERFSFTPSQIEAAAGTTLQIRLTSDDTNHGFRIVGTDVNIEIPKRGRGTATVTFTPTQPGRYTFECSHVCGAGHSFMRGVIIVTEPGAEPR